jgi:muramidase (phage lysozyme)
MPWNKNDDLSIGGFGQPAQNADATGRRIRSESAPVPKRKPEVISPTAKGNELLNFIGKLESSDNYNVVVGGYKAPLTKMTIKEIRSLQKERYDKKLGTPAGKYQIKDTTMDYLIKRMDLRGHEIFDEKLQDQMARHLLEIRGFEDFKAGKISVDQFIKNLSQEWAAIPTDKSNQSYYGNDGKNRALTDYKTVKALLEK